MIQGAHYEPWRNRESSQYAYERIPTIADHLHFIGETNVRDGLGSEKEDAAGGGHAHCGTMIYLGDNWPDRYRNTLFTNNIHGRRINNDLLRRAGSGYVASHGHDLMRSKDPWYMGVFLRYGPDGAVFAIDWSDTGECHSVKNTRRETGRIYKISYRSVNAQPVDFGKLSDRELVERQLHRNDWHVQHARRRLQERAAEGANLNAAVRRLHQIFAEQPNVPQKLRALWALHVIGGLDSRFLTNQLEHESEYVRSWAIRLLCEGHDPPEDALVHFRNLAATGDSSLVRLHLASALQQLPARVRWPIAEALLQRAEDSNDTNLPLMIWYGIEPLVDADLERFVQLTRRTRIPPIANYVARRVTSLRDIAGGLDLLVAQLETIDSSLYSELLSGMIEGLQGRRSVDLPESWPAVYEKLQASPNQSVREQSLQLALIFDDPTALRALRLSAVDTRADSAVRSRAIQALVAKHTAELDVLLLELVKDPATRRASIRGLAEYEHPATATALLQNYSSMDPPTRQDALQTLAARAAWGLQLMEAVEANRVHRNDITAYTARQLYNLRDPELNARIKEVWGELRTTAADKAKLVANYKQRLTPEAIQRADRSAGRALFHKTCANCHRFFDAGGNIGPDITGSQRTNLDYLLQTMIDPSAAVAKDYQMEIIETTGGRIITGLVVSESKTAVTIQTANDRLVIPADEIEERSVSSASLMPEGMLQNLTTDQVRDLLGYLMGPSQVPLPEATGERRP